MATPLGELAAAAREVGRGRLGAQVDTRGRGGESDVGAAILAFNRMSRELAALDRRNRSLAEGQHLSELGEVARGLAHTLRNPLNALGLTVEQLAAGPGGASEATAGERALARRESMVESARRQVRRMDRALRSFLALASNGSAPAEPVEIAQLAREVALEALQDGGGRVGIAVEAEAGEEARVSGVAPELRAVLQALVVNAVEASGEGAGTGDRPPASPSRIQPSGPCERGSVCDRAGRDHDRRPRTGTPPEVRERLFQPHTTTKSHGSGMGLFLAHRIAAGRYGGSLALEPRPDGGTLARLTLGDRESASAPAAAGPSQAGQPETGPRETRPLETDPLETSHGG